MRKGLLGGSFNPPHVGHLALARAALESGRVDRVVLIPAAVPPHKRAPAEVGIDARLAMTRLLCGSDDRLEVSDVEKGGAGPSYTIDTVRRLGEEDPGCAFRLIIGSDMALMFGIWKDHEALLRLAPPLVVERPGFPVRGFPAESFPGLTAAEVDILRAGSLPMPPVAVSSTMIRDALRRGAAAVELSRCLSPEVMEYVKKNNLYTEAT